VPSKVTSAWVERIRQKIRANMIAPPGTPLDLKVEYAVVQRPGGEIAEVTLLSSSGSKSYDEAVGQAIRKSSPLPPPAAGEAFVSHLLIRYFSAEGDAQGQPGYFGVSVREVEKKLAGEIGFAAPFGVLITEVGEGGPAASAGLERGDIVVKVDGRPLESVNTFMRTIADSRAGQKFSLEIWRQGISRQLIVTAGKRPVYTSQAREDLANPAPVYPTLSRRLGEEGTVVLRVQIDSEGLARTVELAQSSGYPRLDQAALEAVRRWRFAPAQRDGRAVEAWVRVPIVFRLQDSAA
jgi:protein TonB